MISFRCLWAKIKFICEEEYCQAQFQSGFETEAVSLFPSKKFHSALESGNFNPTRNRGRFTQVLAGSRHATNNLLATVTDTRLTQWLTFESNVSM